MRLPFKKRKKKVDSCNSIHASSISCQTDHEDNANREVNRVLNKNWRFDYETAKWRFFYTVDDSRTLLFVIDKRITDRYRQTAQLHKLDIILPSISKSSSNIYTFISYVSCDLRVLCWNFKKI